MAIAAFCHAVCPIEEPIELINVAFENPRMIKNHQLHDQNPYEYCPDRNTGRQGVEELCQLYPQREWIFVQVNVSFLESQETQSHIMALAQPCNNVMDLSIAQAFWFACRGTGLVNGKPYQSNTKVLLSGLGADEQLGGYSRHKSAFEEGGLKKLIQEIQMDVHRISERNLGRDCRVVGDHGKEIRYPFLDTQVISYLSHCPIQIKMQLELPKGEGDKYLLRQLMKHEFGLERASNEPKRAIQFGARSAKLMDGKQKGTDKVF
jgi:asparagine synthetase B (glutamine-hydrolysing)